MQNVLRRQFRFLRDDIFLCPSINKKTGRQWVELQQIDLKTGKVIFKEFINCIHVALTKISPEELEKIKGGGEHYLDFYKKHNYEFSSEILEEVDLSIEEKFFALKSWVTGITEQGINAISIQDEIDNLVEFTYPMIHIIFKFLIKAAPEFIELFITKVERECIFEGINHESSMISNLMPILEIIYKNYKKRKKLSEQEKKVILLILSIDPPAKLFHQDYRFLIIKAEADPLFTDKFIEEFRLNFLENPNFKELDLTNFLAPYVEFIVKRLRLKNSFKDRDKEILQEFLKLEIPVSLNYETNGLMEILSFYDHQILDEYRKKINAVYD